MPDPTIRHVPTLNDNSSLPFLTYRYKIILQLNDFPLKQYRYKTAISTISYFRGAFSSGRLLWIEHKFTIDAAVRLGYVPLRTTSAHLNAPVAQLDRVLDSDSKGHRFESCRVRQIPPTRRYGHRSYVLASGRGAARPFGQIGISFWTRKQNHHSATEGLSPQHTETLVPLGSVLIARFDPSC